MALVLYHHPFTRAANVIWMLEEVGVDYELRHLDVMAGEHKKAEILALNPMGKLPILVDDETVVTESAAIALYLADRYSPGVLAPALDDPARATYLRWSFFAPAVIEPGVMAKQAGWTYRASSAGWGEHSAMVAAIEHAVPKTDYLLGKRFTMADLVFGGTLAYMLQFGLLDKTPELVAYTGRLAERPANQRAKAKNEEIIAARGLKTS